jgi:hypothetical protein
MFIKSNIHSDVVGDFDDKNGWIALRIFVHIYIRFYFVRLLSSI